jgi:hypothetical protein
VFHVLSMAYEISPLLVAHLIIPRFGCQTGFITMLLQIIGLNLLFFLAPYLSAIYFSELCVLRLSLVLGLLIISNTIPLPLIALSCVHTIGNT